MSDEYSKSVAMIAADQDRRALAEAEARGYARADEMWRKRSIAAALDAASPGAAVVSAERLAEYHAAEARGYSRGELAGFERYASEILGPQNLKEMASRCEGIGYTRGVEDAAKIVDAVGVSSPADLAASIRALLKPKGEAK